MPKQSADYRDFPGYGFPVRIEGCPTIRFRGETLLAPNWSEVEHSLLQILAYKPARLSGAEVKFIRQCADLTLAKFAQRLGKTHVAVKKWEAKRQEPTRMEWPTEKDIRLFALQLAKVNAREFVKAYKRLEQVPDGVAEPIRIDCSKMSAA